MSEDKDKQPLEDLVQKVRDSFSDVLEDDNIELAVIIFVHKDSKEPQVCRKGHWYDSSALMNTVMSAYRAKATMELGL